MKDCNHINAYITLYGKYYCPDCDDMMDWETVRNGQLKERANKHWGINEEHELKGGLTEPSY